MPDFDVVVVGGGPAGAISALKCSELGFKVLLIESGDVKRHKPCAGVLTPMCVDVLRSLGMSIPRNVMCSPAMLGLYYVLPNGENSGGRVQNFKFLNVNRDLFDQWLRQNAAESGVKILYTTEFLNMRESNPIRILAKQGCKIFEITTRYLIGADGVFSKVRKQLYGLAKVNFELISQEYWMAKGNFEDCLYVFFRKELAPGYAYVVLKNDLCLVGLGSPKSDYAFILTYINQFKKRLRKEFAFKPRSLVRNDVWAIPYAFLLHGIGNTILVGDAAGFCNTLTGEGIRLAIETGVAAGNAIQDAVSCDRPLASTYRDRVERITRFICRAHQFATGLTDEGREEFVNFELGRTPFL